MTPREEKRYKRLKRDLPAWEARSIAKTRIALDDPKLKALRRRRREDKADIKRSGGGKADFNRKVRAEYARESAIKKGRSRPDIVLGAYARIPDVAAKLERRRIQFDQRRERELDKRRRYRYLREHGFTTKEAKQFCSIADWPPYMESWIMQRSRFIRDAKRRGWTDKQIKEYIEKQYKRQKVSDPWAMFRTKEDKHKGKDPTYKSPWEYKRKQKDFIHGVL